MASPVFQENFVVYLSVASLSVILWDILDNMKNEYRLLFRLRLGLPTVVYFLSRISVLSFALISTIFWTAPSISCKSFEAAFIAFFIMALPSTLFLSYLRVCAVWHWNHFIIALFGASWLSVFASGFTVINVLKGSENPENDRCVENILRGHILAPFITSFINHTLVFLAITYGVCRNTIGRDLTFKDSIRLMIGRSLPTFSKALLHDSQVCYIVTMMVAATTIAWYYIWQHLLPLTSFKLALVHPYVVVVNLMICRVFRNTKLGRYTQVYSRSQPHIAPNRTMPMPWNPRHDNSDTQSDVTPIQIAVSQTVEYKSDYPPLTRSRRPTDFLDFGMV